MPNTTNPNKEVQLHFYDFTIPEVSFDTPEELCIELNKWFKKWCFQLEEGEDSGYRHFQGRGSLIKRKRFTHLKNSEQFKTAFKGIHISPTSSEVHDKGGISSFSYVMKADTKVGPTYNDTEWQEPPPMTQQLQTFLTAVEGTGLYPYQTELEQKFQRTDDRHITYIVDLVGNVGKTMFCEWMEYRRLCCGIPTMLNMEDIMQAVMCLPKSKAYVIDMPRALKKEKLYAFYSGLEELKNGRVYDKRYNFKVARFNRPQIFVFSNNFPEFGVMSMDRWEVYTINSDKTMTKIDPDQYSIYSEVTKVQHDASVHRAANT